LVKGDLWVVGHPNNLWPFIHFVDDVVVCSFAQFVFLYIGGPDQQLLWGKFGRTFFGDTLSADLNFWWRRIGERHSRDTMYVINSSESYKGTRDDPQPYGAVEEELSFWASVSYRKFFVDAELRGGATLYKNRGNVESGWKTYPFIGVFLSSGIASVVK